MIGETVTVISRAHSGLDAYHEMMWKESSVIVENVLVAPASTSDLSGNLRTDGDRLVFELHFPKSFTASLRGADVLVRGVRYRVVGDPQSYTVQNTPTVWNRKCEVERIDG